MDDIRAFQLIDEIDEQLPKLVKEQTFNPEILNILDDLDADRRDIDAIPWKIGKGGVAAYPGHRCSHVLREPSAGYGVQLL